MMPVDQIQWSAFIEAWYLGMVLLLGGAFCGLWGVKDTQPISFERSIRSLVALLAVMLLGIFVMSMRAIHNVRDFLSCTAIFLPTPTLIALLLVLLRSRPSAKTEG